MFDAARLLARWASGGGPGGAFRRLSVGDRAPRGAALASLPRLTRVGGTRGRVGATLGRRSRSEGGFGSRFSSRSPSSGCRAIRVPSTWLGASWRPLLAIGVWRPLLLLAFCLLAPPPASAQTVGAQIKTSDGAVEQPRLTIESGAASVNAYFQNAYIGIDSTNPKGQSPAVKLDIVADGNTTAYLQMKDSQAGGNAWHFRGGAGTGVGADNLGLWNVDGANYTMSWLSGGTVGIGTAAPQGVLQVQLPTWTNRDTDGQHVIFNNVADSNYGIRFGFTSTGGYGVMNVLNPGVAWGNLILQDDPSTTGGNVGIGTTVPGAKLHVVSALNPARLRLANTAGERKAQLEFLGDDDGAGSVTKGAVLRYDGAGNRIELRGIDNVATDTDELLGIAITRVSGNVGVGVAVPDKKLHVVNSATSTNLRIGSGGSGAGSQDTFDINTTDFGAVSVTHMSTNLSYDGGWTHLNSGYDGWTMLQRVDNANTGYFEILHAAQTTGTQTEVLRITAAGNVGIGSAIPGGRLDVTLDSTNAILFERASGVDIDTPSGQSLRLSAAGTERLTVHSGGNIGMGSTTPATRLDILGDGAINDGITLSNTSTATDGSENSVFLQLTNNAPLANKSYLLQVVADNASGPERDGDFEIRQTGGGGTRFVIDKTTANVGIGSSNPQGVLDIVGDGSRLIIPRKSTTGDPTGTNGSLYYNTADLKFRAYQNGAWTDLVGGSGGMSIGGTVTSGTTGSILFVGSGPVLSQNNANFFWDNTNFRLGIGTAAPASRIDIADNQAAGTALIRVGDDSFLADIDVSNTLGLYGNGDSTQGHLKLGSAGPTISGVSGNVGIGDTNPGYKLTVAGDVYLTSGRLGFTAGGVDVTKFIEGWGIRYVGSADHPFQVGTASSLLVGYNGDGTNYGAGNALISGNVGIGSTNPQANLDIVASSPEQRIRCSDNTSGTASLRFIEGDAGATSGVKLQYNASTNDLTFINTATSGNILTVDRDNGGTVGVGITTPSRKLVVHGGASSSYVMVQNDTTGSTTGDGLEISHTGTTAYVWNYESGNLELAGGNGSGTTRVNGALNVTGALSKGSGSFLIDHPLDPANKVLRHSFVESPEMMNVYKGRARLRDGVARIELPSYFDALNHPDTREAYVTCVGGWSPIYVDGPIKGNSFTVRGAAGTRADQEFSWIVMAVRNDPFARMNPIVMEEEKGTGTAKDYAKGEYLHAAAYGVLPFKKELTEPKKADRTRSGGAAQNEALKADLAALSAKAAKVEALEARIEALERALAKTAADQKATAQAPAGGGR